MFGLANPARFLRLANAVLPWAAGATGASLAAGLYLALFASPADYQQGETVRIMYLHVPSAWMALFCYLSLAAASLAGLVWKHPLADLIARAASPVGAAFTFLCLLTGSLWGRPMWGAWWVWDARLTSMLVPLLLMAAAFTGYFVVLVILRLRAEIASAKLRNLTLLAAQGR